jgi:hypothetical protein
METIKVWQAIGLKAAPQQIGIGAECHSCGTPLAHTDSCSRLPPSGFIVCAHGCGGLQIGSAVTITAPVGRNSPADMWSGHAGEVTDMTPDGRSFAIDDRVWIHIQRLLGRA